MNNIILFTTLVYGYLAFLIFGRKPEYMAYFLIIFMLTSFHNALPTIYLFSLSIWLEILCVIIMAGLYIKGRVKKYSFKYAKWVFIPVILLLFLRIMILDMSFANQTNRMLIIFLFIFHVIFSFIRTKQQFYRLLYAISLCMLINVIETVYSFYSGAFHSSEYHDIIRAASFSLNPNGAAILFVTLIPIAMYVYKNYSSRKIKNFLGVVIFLSVFATLLTVSRTGFVGLIMLLLFYMLKNKKLIIPLAFLLMVMTFSVDFFGSSAVSDYIYRFGTILDTEKNNRTQLWGPYLKIINKHPLLGRVAIDNISHFLDADEQYIIDVRHSHNAYLSLASTYGIPVALFFFSPYLMVWSIFRNYPGLSVDIKNMIFIMVLLRMIVFTVSHGYLTFLTFLPPILIILYINIPLNNKENYAITQVS
ncbi:MAG: O-antigen ligase family protein [Candidatus Cloacimonetes bacterium]|nr:O-antigen ligase family protein [Candidatus Cloacimonadota bacterium]